MPIRMSIPFFQIVFAKPVFGITLVPKIARPNENLVGKAPAPAGHLLNAPTGGPVSRKIWEIGQKSG
jgi:hypothetical protein